MNGWSQAGRRSFSARSSTPRPGRTSCPGYAVDYYVETLSNPESLHGSFQLYRAFSASATQNEERKRRPLTMPVLAIGGEQSSGTMVEETMKLAAEDVDGLVISGIGHWLAEQAPDEMLAALTEFLAPYREAAVSHA
jgi:pimeloyl-ACP methyl ester carboxylesterase